MIRVAIVTWRTQGAFPPRYLEASGTLPRISDTDANADA